VTDSYIVRRGGRPRGYGFIEFDSSSSADNALAANGESLDGRDINIEKARGKIVKSNFDSPREGNNRDDRSGGGGMRRYGGGGGYGGGNRYDGGGYGGGGNRYDGGGYGGGRRSNRRYDDEDDEGGNDEGNGNNNRRRGHDDDDEGDGNNRNDRPGRGGMRRYGGGNRYDGGGYGGGGNRYDGGGYGGGNRYDGGGYGGGYGRGGFRSFRGGRGPMRRNFYNLRNDGPRNNGRRVYQKRSDAEKEKSTSTVYVSNLPFSIDDAQLAKLFNKYKVKTTHVVQSISGRSRGYGFVEFETEEDQQKAISEMENFEVKGSDDRPRNITVKVALVEKPPTFKDNELENDDE